jgi:hypothetical protein
MSDWPELYSQNMDAVQAIQASQEAITVLSQYPGVTRYCNEHLTYTIR